MRYATHINHIHVRLWCVGTHPGCPLMTIGLGMHSRVMLYNANGTSVLSGSSPVAESHQPEALVPKAQRLS